MDIKETGKKLKPFAPVLSVALVTACVAGSLSGYEAPVYAATREETPVKKEETKDSEEIECPEPTDEKDSVKEENVPEEKTSSVVVEDDTEEGKTE